MTVALPLHTLATIVWLGGLFFCWVVLRPAIRDVDVETAMSLWHRTLSRFFVFAWISIALILASGITLVVLKFGGFSGIPPLHRGNMFVGIPALALHGYLYFVPWQQLRRAVSRRDWTAARGSIGKVGIVMAIILALGLIASVVSAAGRYYV